MPPFSNQNLSPSVKLKTIKKFKQTKLIYLLLSLRNCSVAMQANVGPTSPSGSGISL